MTPQHEHDVERDDESRPAGLVDLIDAVQRQLAEQHAEEVALLACLAETREQIALLSGKLSELRLHVGAGVKPEQPLTGAQVRDACARLRTFTLSELVAELEQPPALVRRYLKPMQLSGAVRSAGKLGRSPLYEYVKPDEAGPTEHPTQRPPEKEPPAGTEARATGVPVRRAAADKVTRRGRSTPGQRMKVVNRDRNYERQREAIEKRIEEQKSKAQKDPKWKRKK